MNLKFTVDGKVPYLNCSVPGFKYDDFDRSGEKISSDILDRNIKS